MTSRRRDWFVRAVDDNARVTMLTKLTSKEATEEATSYRESHTVEYGPMDWYPHYFAKAG